MPKNFLFLFTQVQSHIWIRNRSRVSESGRSACHSQQIFIWRHQSVSSPSAPNLIRILIPMPIPNPNPVPISNPTPGSVWSAFGPFCCPKSDPKCSGRRTQTHKQTQTEKQPQSQSFLMSRPQKQKGRNKKVEWWWQPRELQTWCTWRIIFTCLRYW